MVPFILVVVVAYDAAKLALRRAIEWRKSEASEPR
jgi:hypothetical protein